MCLSLLSLARMKNKDFEKIREDEKLMRVEKAKARRKLWKEWRMEETEEEQSQAGDCTGGGQREEHAEDDEAGRVQHVREAVGEPPGTRAR